MSPGQNMRVSATADALSLIESLTSKHGRLLFHQSGGCCDGSAPMCYPLGDFKIGSQDVLLGTVDNCPVFISGSQFEAWKHTHLILDVVPGRGSGFSLEAPEGVRFITRSRLYSEIEKQTLAKLGPPPRGPESVEPIP